MNQIKIKQISGLSTELGQKANESQVLKISNNLSDVNAVQARTNLDIHSKSEVTALVAGVTSSRSVATIAARSALTGLKVTDKVFVVNDGDGKWAYYMVTAITNGNGSTSTFEKLADKDIFDNAMTAAAIKTAYESNADTNAFTNAEKTKLAYLTATSAVNLDTLKTLVAQHTTDINNATATANNAASSVANKQDKFTETHESFSGLMAEDNTDVIINLSQPILANTDITVFFNSLRISSYTFATGSTQVTINVPYITEPTDEIIVYYKF